MKSIQKDSFRMRCCTVLQDFISTSPPAFPLFQLLTLNSIAHPCFRERNHTIQLRIHFVFQANLQASKPPSSGLLLKQTRSSKGKQANTTSIPIFQTGSKEKNYPGNSYFHSKYLATQSTAVLLLQPLRNVGVSTIR